MTRLWLVGGLGVIWSALGQTPPLTIVNESFPIATVGVEYTEALRYSGGCQSDLTAKPWFTVDSGTLPPGLAIETPSSAGSVLTGTPSAQGSYTVILKVADTCGASATHPFTLVVNPAPKGVGTRKKQR